MFALFEMLGCTRLTEVVDVGANPIDGQPPYSAMLAQALCNLTGFEPQARPLAELRATQGSQERYLPHALGDGALHTLHVCRGSGLTSLFPPDEASLRLFSPLIPLAEVLYEVPIQTHRLDDLVDIESLDLLKLDVQGSELAILQGSRTKLMQAVAVQVEVSFVTLYRGQPAFGEIDGELRRQGFLPHCFEEIKQAPIAPSVIDGEPGRGLRQLLEADIVYVRDIVHSSSITNEQLRQLALIAHCCYKSFDLALHCVALLEKRGSLPPGSTQDYAALLRARINA